MPQDLAPQDPAPTLLTVYIDVTDTVATLWRAGIQRTVCQLVAHLRAHERLDVVPVVWLESVRSFRRLTAAEAAKLSSDPPRPAPRSPGQPRTPSRSARLLAGFRPALGGVRRLLVRLLGTLHLEAPLRAARRRVLRATRDRDLLASVVHPSAGSVLLELDTVWNNVLVDRAELYRELRGRGVHIAALVYDLLPQTHPEWFEDSMVAVSDRTIAAEAGADVVFAISEHTAAELSAWSGARGLRPPDPTVIELGADATSGRGCGPLPRLPGGLEQATFVLVVGTVEPRKNHRLVLDVAEVLWQDHPDLHVVVVGRPGWRNDDVVAALEHHPEAGRRLVWLRDCSDAVLGALYERARLVLVPSVTEGYGLPVIEALRHGVPVVASNGGALGEAGQGIVDLLDPFDVGPWAELVGRHLDDEAFHSQRRDRVATYRLPTWADASDQMAAVLLQRLAA